MSEQSFRYSLLAPIILDGNGNGVTLVSVATSKVMFDMDGDGIKDRTGWFGADDGILVFDANRNGIVDNGSEISFQSYLSGAKSDLEGLKAFDSNGNGMLDAGDAKFGQFAIWVDDNQNGVTDTDELTSLDEADIAAIGLAGQATGATPNGRDNTLFATGTFKTKDGTTAKLGDVFLAFEPGKDAGVPGTGGDGTTDAPAKAAPTLAISTHAMERKAKKYVVEAKDGVLFAHLKTQPEMLDPRAGQIGSAMIMRFSESAMGMLAPIVLDLNGDGLDLVKRKKSGARFDMDGDGVADRTGWVGRSDGILVLDRNGDGLITSAAELSFLSEKADAKNSFDALGTLDSNKDGKLDKADKRFGELKIWQDANRNGVTDTGELRSLTDLGIVEIGLAARANDKTAKIGNNLLVSTSYFRRADGTTGSTGEAALAFDPSSTRSQPGAPVGAARPFGFAEEQLNEMRAAVAESGASTGGSEALTAAMIDPLVARMTQAMSIFGTTGEASLTLRGERAEPLYQLYA